jgi:hypothetical protein
VQEVAVRNPAQPKKKRYVSISNENRTYMKNNKGATNGGKTFSAARRGTENPPCVLVSLAVNVLQK